MWYPVSARQFSEQLTHNLLWFEAGFLCLSTIDVWGWMVLCCQGYVVHCILGLYPLDVNEQHTVITNSNASRSSASLEVENP